MKIALVSSVGGHLSELLELAPIFRKHDHFFVLNDDVPYAKELGAPCYTVVHAERDWRVALNFWEFWRIFRKERPDVVISLGAGPAVPAFIVAGALGVSRLYIETFASVERPSLTGRLVYRLGVYERYGYQWPQLARHLPKADCIGWVYDFSDSW